MTISLPTKDQLKSPYHASLADAIMDAVAQGKIKVGAKLPPHRDLAYDLGLSVHTVSKAYEILLRKGLVISHVGRGTFVQDPNKPLEQPFALDSDSQKLIDLSISRPLFDRFHVDEMANALNRINVGLDHETYLSCRPINGLEKHRRIGADWLGQDGIECDKDNLFITNGVCHGLSMALSAVAHAGDVIVSEKVAHYLLMPTCNYLGLHLVGLETDEEGILPDAFETACLQHKVKAYFTAPNVANPTASLMSEARRRMLVAIARKHNVFIIEDDVLNKLIENRPPAFAAMAPEITLYLTSFTKVVMSGLRTGYLVVPKSLVPTIESRMVVFSWMGTPLIAEIAARWIENGLLEDFISWQRDALRLRHEIILTEMDDVKIFHHPSAFHFWLPLPDCWKTDEFVQHAKALGVVAAPSKPFLTKEAGDLDAIRVSVAAGQSRENFQHGLRILKGLLLQKSEPLIPVI